MDNNLETVKKQFENDRYAKSLGIILDKVTEDTVTMHMQLRDDMLNMYNCPHGAVIYSFADAAFSVLGNNKNNISVALDCSITYHAGPEPGSVLVVEGKTLSQGRKTASYLFNIYTENNGERKPVATMKSISYRTGKQIDPGTSAGTAE
jgi:acyl-CoA thioesterase